MTGRYSLSLPRWTNICLCVMWSHEKFMVLCHVYFKARDMTRWLWAVTTLHRTWVMFFHIVKHSCLWCARWSIYVTDVTKSHPMTDLTWEVYRGRGVQWLYRAKQEGLAFYKGGSACAGGGLLATVGMCLPLSSFWDVSWRCCIPGAGSGNAWLLKGKPVNRLLESGKEYTHSVRTCISLSPHGWLDKIDLIDFFHFKIAA